MVAWDGSTRRTKGASAARPKKRTWNHTARTIRPPENQWTKGNLTQHTTHTFNVKRGRKYRTCARRAQGLRVCGTRRLWLLKGTWEHAQREPHSVRVFVVTWTADAAGRREKDTRVGPDVAGHTSAFHSDPFAIARRRRAANEAVRGKTSTTMDFVATILE